jgi:hypothetical protein
MFVTRDPYSFFDTGAIYILFGTGDNYRLFVEGILETVCQSDN